MYTNESFIDNLSRNNSTNIEPQNQHQNLELHEDLAPERNETHKSSIKVARTNDQRFAQADAFRNARQKLQNMLNLTQEKFTSVNSEYQSGQSERCSYDAKNARILEAYKDYFLSSDPYSWHADVLGYKIAMQARFRDIKTPSKEDLRDLHSIFRARLREYIMSVISDLKLDSNIEPSNMISDNMIKDLPLEHLVQKASNTLLSQLPNPDVRQLSLSLQNTKTAAERVPLYIQYYCTVAVDDTPQQRNFKAKYARLFESRLNHDEVLSAMRKEALDLNNQRLNALHKELGELQLAQSAHLKNKARKAEKYQQVRDRESYQMSKCCSLERCRVGLDLNKKNVECALCEWLHRKGSDKGRFFYCSVEHAEEDFDSHDRHQHQCVSGNRCFYYPQSGPSGETGASGICSFCIQSMKKLFYFCSKECFNHNFEWHENHYHTVDHQREDTNVLEHFQCSENMQLLP